MNYKTFYSELGKLLYSIAKSDGNIHKKEYDKLKQIVSETLVPAEKHNDSFGTDTAYYTEIEFDYLVENDLDPRVCFDSFISYIEKHKTAIHDDLRDRIYVCVRDLARAYKGITNSESTIIVELWEKMSEIFKTN